MINRFLAFIIACLCGVTVSAQSKKTMEHSDIGLWKKIEQQKLSNDGQWASWVQVSVTEGDPALWVWSAASKSGRSFARATEARFSEDSKYLIFRIKAPLDSVKAQRRKKVKDDDLPKDTLGILTLATGQLEKIPRLRSFTLPEKWSGWLAYQCDPAKPEAAKKDTSKNAAPDREKVKLKKNKKEDKDNGYRLILRELSTGTQDTIAYVSQYVMAKRGARLLLYSTGVGDTLLFKANTKVRQPGVYLLDLTQRNTTALFRKKGKYQQLSLDEYGSQAAFLADLDTTKARIRPWQLMYWKENGKDSASLVAAPQSDCFKPLAEAAGLGRGQSPGVSEHYKPVFSEDGEKLYFGAGLPPVLNDTTLLPEEIVQVEVWAWTEKRMYTEAKVRMENEKKRAYPLVFYPKSQKIIPLSTPQAPELRFQKERNAAYALGLTEEPYAQYVTWEGTAHKDLYVVNLKNGEKEKIVTDLRCNPNLSPDARYIYWWSDPDTAWFAYNIEKKTRAKLTDNKAVAFYNVETDIPDYPNEYGIAAWTTGDEYVLIYDQYDLWKIDPNGQKKPQRLTQGRERQTVYRFLRLDQEKTFVSLKDKLLLHGFNDVNKSESYSWLQPGEGKVSLWLDGPFAYSRQVLKAQNSEEMLFTKENFGTFPDLQFASPKEAPLKISTANPQQADYRWGSIELISWTSLSGKKLQGLLVKPEDYDPAKRYPVIVNFYEKLSDELNQHRSPNFHRSQINYTFYANRGYVIFAPDIPYQTGYPGQSAYDAIVSGVGAIIDKGIADPTRVALQGHSWGGYQAAYLITKTNMFRCAEAGAPVANMTSAYGGIRWETGLSRAFQYEHQQSRIGGTLWEYPMRYLENSPLFSLDRVNTPVLILHNDKDGAVPWYQGIELYSGLRRLGKPAWMLNYNDEPHWPVKLQNRVDFQTRMQQFFDHYLMDKPRPRWMGRGVPPAEKGIMQGLELDGE